MKSLATYSAYLENALQQAHFPTQPANLYDPLRYFLQLGGKRMRPMLSLMACKMTGSDFEKALPAALAVEYFHNFSLIHDDIMDAAPIRRGQATVHERWNANIAILSGDVLLVQAYEQLAKYDSSTFHALFNVFNKTAIEVCEGQQMDMDFEERTDVRIAEYIEMIRLKTSVLLGCALEFGAIAGDASSKDRKAIYNFGQHIGIAFQIQDDILDLYADPETFGKQVGGDVISNKKTLLNLKAQELASAEQIEVLKQLSTTSDLHYKVEKTKELYQAIGARQACEVTMQEHHSIAMNALSTINVSQAAKEPLIALADYLLVREI